LRLRCDVLAVRMTKLAGDSGTRFKKRLSMSTSNPKYGTINFELVGRWLHLPAEEDGPFWALNLMKYHEVAQYADGRESSITGAEADDAYAPIGPLAAVGALPALLANVTAQPTGEPDWDRIAIVRYPTRASFFEMQERDDFKDAHEHKEAGMEFTIVMGCQPLSTSEASKEDGELVMRVMRFTEGTTQAGADPEGVTPVAHFEVEGVIVGDKRRWDHVRFDRATPEAIAALTAVEGIEEQVITVLGRPFIERIVESVVNTASN